MKIYEGEYSYDGVFKRLKDGSNELKVRSFTYDGKYYLPKDVIRFTIKEEPDNWISVKDDSIAVTEGGKTLDEALGNAFMMAVDQYEFLGFTDMPLSEDARELREKFLTWEVY